MKKEEKRKLLHKRYGRYECRFNPLEVYEKIITCKWCGKKYKTSGYPYIDLKLTPQSDN